MPETAMNEDPVPPMSSVRRPSLEVVLAVSAVAWGAFANSNRLLDNSFFTHLATGRLILDEGGVPSADPYSFTAAGTDWTVQSWLPSVVYASAEQVGGVAGLRVVGMVLGGVAAWLVWRLSQRCTSLLPRLALLFGTLAISTSLWGLRPYMFGVIGLGVTWLVAVDRTLPVWSLIPVFWMWANSHGSFVLGVGLLVLLAIGTRLDGDESSPATRAMAFGILGTASAVIGPLGFRVLTFPLTALERADDLRQIQEWQPPDMVDLYERLYLVLIVVVIVSLLRRPSWQMGLPAIAFLVAGMVAQRNLVLAAMVFVPVVASNVGGFGQLRTTDRPRIAAPVAALCALAGLVGGVALAARPLDGIGGYPTQAIARLGPGTRMAAPDLVGNLLEVLDGTATPVFIDDRVDMFPPEVFQASVILVDGRPEWSSVLEDHDVDLVLWQRARALGSVLATDEDWRIMYSDENWVVACRRSSCP